MINLLVNILIYIFLVALLLKANILVSYKSKCIIFYDFCLLIHIFMNLCGILDLFGIWLESGLI